jgi:ArsR family metal-binding transcriptional regulator
MLIPGYSLTLSRPKCNLFAETPHAKALLPADISQAMPYLNGELQGCRYVPFAPALTLTHQGRALVLWPREIALGQCADEADARAVLDGVCALINDVWERREQIAPNHEGSPRLTAMAAYRLLPGTDCRECGETSCLAFAVKLAAGQAQADACTPLLAGECEEQRAALIRELPAGRSGVSQS